MTRESPKERLKNVVDKLYHAPGVGSPRQVFALPRKAAELLPRLPTLAVVSITAPDRPLAMLDGFEHVLRLSFADCDFLDPDLSTRARASLKEPFTREHAAAIVAFVDALPDAIRSVVVHCEGGYSRSCAVALALHEMRGYAADLSRFSDANPSVWSVLTGRPRNQFAVEAPSRSLSRRLKR